MDLRGCLDLCIRFVELSRLHAYRDPVKRAFLEIGATLSRTNGAPEIAVEYRRRQTLGTSSVSCHLGFTDLLV